ncbi:unnamed protein product, partial [marine sediment metagenome]
MKETINKKMKEASVLLIAAAMVLSTVAVTADTNDQSPTFISAGADYILHPQQTNVFDPDWLHFDDGTNADAVGLANGGRFEFAIRLTPDELADWSGYNISTVRHHHGWSKGNPFLMAGTIKIYGEGTSTEPGSLITSEPFEVTENDWFDVKLSEPVLIAGDEDIWVSVHVTHYAGQYPAGCDDGPMIKGKGGWIYLLGIWEEIGAIGYNVNWNIWVKLKAPSDPPEKPETPD